MSTSGEGDRSPSVSSSEEESESDEVRESGREAIAAPPTVARSMKVLSAAPRGTDSDGGTESSSSSSESGEEAEPTADAWEAPSRRKSYLRSIRARKPKKKVYVTPKREDLVIVHYVL